MKFWGHPCVVAQALCWSIWMALSSLTRYCSVWTVPLFLSQYPHPSFHFPKWFMIFCAVKSPLLLPDSTNEAYCAETWQYWLVLVIHVSLSQPASSAARNTLKRKSGRWKLQFTDEVLELPFSRKKSCSSACPLELSSDLHHPQTAVDAAFHLALSCCTHKCKMELVNHFLEKARDINVSTAEWVYVKMKSSWVA